VNGEKTLFQEGRRAGCPIPSSCLGQGKCRECIVEVKEGLQCLGERTPAEKYLKPGYRMSCRARLARPGAVSFGVPENSPMQIQLTSNLEKMPAAEISSSAPIGEALGLAVDVGTTTVALELIDMESGRVLSRGAFENGQRYAGSDIMARIAYDSAVGGRELQRVLIRQVNRFIDSLKFPGKRIRKVVVAGNSTMRDLFFGLPVESIGQSPYRSITQIEMAEGKRETTALVVPAGKLRLKTAPDAEVYGLPIIAGHIGADMAACLVAVGFFDREETIAVMDLGTNTELVVGNRHRAMAASCPAGPAFEGGGLVHGMPGLAGAIEKFHIQNGDLHWDVIGGGEPTGICGSGYVSLLSELKGAGLMNAYGRLETGDEAIHFDTSHPLGIYERDINELAQAKGANAAGLRIVFKRFGIGFDEVATFYVAGGFGRYLDLDAAREIGLIPNMEPGKMQQVGNASLFGASKVLRGEIDPKLLEERIRGIDHVELETDPDFFDYFTFGCQFNPLNPTLESEAV